MKPLTEDLPLIRLKRTAQFYPDIRIQQMKLTFPWQLTRGASDYEFVEKAYLSTLGRWPDREGLQDYLDQLANRSLERIDVLVELRRSEEGQKVKAPIVGIKAYRILVKVKKRLTGGRS